MPSKLSFYAQMADHTAKQVTGSFGEWTAFLETMGRLYKYPFHEQLMIFAQKPNATACDLLCGVVCHLCVKTQFTRHPHPPHHQNRDKAPRSQIPRL